MKDNNSKIEYLTIIIGVITLVLISLLYFYIKKQVLGETTSFGELSTQVIPDLIAALIAFVMIFILFNRMGIGREDILVEKITKAAFADGNLKFGVQQEIDQKYDLKEKLKSCKSLDVVGYSNRYFISGVRPELETAILSGMNLRVIILEPNSSASKLLMDHQILNEIEVDLQDVLRRIKNLNETIVNSKKKRAGKIDVRTLNWLPACSMIIVKPKSNKNPSIKIKFYAPSGRTALTQIESHTIINEVKDTKLFEFYSNEFEKMWNSSKTITL